MNTATVLWSSRHVFAVINITEVSVVVPVWMPPHKLSDANDDLACYHLPHPFPTLSLSLNTLIFDLG